jgi:hypothetical protein
MTPARKFVRVVFGIVAGVRLLGMTIGGIFAII